MAGNSDNSAKPLSIALVGASGLVGRMVMEEAMGREGVRLTAIARREFPLPHGAKMELVVADPARWGEVIADVRPNAMICALGTTWKQAGRDEDAFRAVDYDLVMATAEAAKEHGTERFAVVSSVGTNLVSKSFYLRVKAEVERDLAKLKFKRLDILKPGLLKGARIDDSRAGEGVAKILSPILDPLMMGGLRDMRSIKGAEVAAGALGLVSHKAGGRFAHNNDSIKRAAREWYRAGEEEE
ncbi:MAG: NAD(P)H-binding protein [Erythrobacter sp.]